MRKSKKKLLENPLEIGFDRRKSCVNRGFPSPRLITKGRSTVQFFGFFKLFYNLVAQITNFDNLVGGFNLSEQY